MNGSPASIQPRDNELPSGAGDRSRQKPKESGLPFGCNAKGGIITRQLSADVFETSASRAEGISPLPRSTEEATRIRAAVSFGSRRKSAAQ